MKKWLNDLFSENSNISAIRVMAVIVCITACYIAIHDGEGSVGLVATLLGTAFTGKVAQKVIENKGVDDNGRQK